MPKDFSRIITSIPLDSTAAAVVRPGYHYEPISDIYGVKQWFSKCPELVEPPRNQPQFVNLTGKRFGELIVIGYGGTHPTKPGSRWVVQCRCGRYEYRRTQSITGSKAKQRRRCTVCDNTANVREGFDSKLISSPGRSTVR